MSSPAEFDHPPAEQLREFQVGKLNEEQSAHIKNHLQVCDLCNRYLENLSQTDELFNVLRGLEDTPVDRNMHQANRSEDESRLRAKSNPESTILGHSRGPLSDHKAMPEIAGYELLGELGRGGMGVVYKARHVQLNRLVAIKLLSYPEHRTQEVILRFRKEAELLALLKHPNIVQIYEVGFLQEPNYLAIEYVPGKDLAQHLADDPLTPRAAAELIERLARAMQTAHQSGVVHRDLKPSNVLLDSDTGMPKITDFGLAQNTTATTQLTREGTVMGTPSYMAPEQADVKNLSSGPQSDVYALGAILYECLVGKPPFKSPDPVQTMLQVLKELPVPPTRMQSQLPRDLEVISLKCLEKEPHRRYSSADLLADDLRRFLNDEPISARPISQKERLWRWMKRHPAQSGFISAVLVAFVALVVAGVAVLYQGQLQTINDALVATKSGLVKALDDSETAKTKAEQAKDAETRAKNSLERVLYARRLSLAQAAIVDGDRQTALKHLAACRKNLRHWEWYYLDHLCHEAKLTLTGHTKSVTSVTFSPDNQYLASGSEDKSVKLWDRKTGAVIRTLQGHSGGVRHVAFGRNRKNLVSHGVRDTVIFWDTVSGKERVRLNNPFFGVKKRLISSETSFALSRNGRRFAVANNQLGKVWNLDLSGDAIKFAPLFEFKTSLVGKKGKLIEDLVFSPDSKYLFVSEGNPFGVLLNATTGEPVLKTERFASRARFVAYGPTGALLAATNKYPVDHEFRTFREVQKVLNDALMHNPENPEDIENDLTQLKQISHQLGHFPEF